jgi:broad specificity phosphatase PhoE
MTRVFLVRHALAAAPGDLRLPGPDLPLLPEGTAQARQLARRLRPFAPSAVYTSDARRARETAAIIAAICGVPLTVSDTYREIDFGVWAGQSYAEILAADPAAGEWFADPGAAPPPGGEAIAAAATRVLQAIEALAHAGGDRAVIVGHAGSLRLALAAALGLPLAAYWRLRLDCASLTVMTWTGDGAVLERLNDTAHLDVDFSGQSPHSCVMLNEVKHLDSMPTYSKGVEILRFAQDDNSASSVNSAPLSVDEKGEHTTDEGLPLAHACCKPDPPVSAAGVARR